MVIKNIDSIPQKKLKAMNFWYNALYLLLTFIAPVVTIIVMTFCSGDVKESWRMPVLTVVILFALFAGVVRFFKKKVNSIKILNLDGTYNEKMRSFKHIMQFISSAFLPIILIILTALFATFLKDCIDFYMKIIIISLGFVIAGLLVDKLILSELEEELEIRDKLATQNAIEIRKNKLMN